MSMKAEKAHIIRIKDFYQKKKALLSFNVQLFQICLIIL
ncbi:conserved hypothetical protein [Streptococcus equi subsp. zooepidemicus ATCC 35246]|nr:conserved hypothetical protein [Streptococcus equi subsp. zooepidemicus ATCC 35246]